MRIGIDARELTGRPTGVGRYLTSLVREWDATAAAGHLTHEFVLYAPDVPPPPVAQSLPALRLRWRTVPGAGGTWWEQTQLPRAVREDRLDILFAPAYTAPILAGCPVAVTIHDVSYLARPEWFRPRERWRRTWLTRASARKAAVVLTDSRFSASEIQHRLAVPERRIRVVRLGVGLPPRPDATLPREPLVLFAGSIFNRRRVPDLIEAFAIVAGAREDARLVIAGEDRTWPAQPLVERVRAHALEARVSLRAYVDDDELARLYARASAFVFLSEYEGFGFTPLEALAAGVPVVVLDTPIAREVYEDAVLYTRAGDIAGVANAILACLDRRPHVDLALAAASRLLPRYSWPRAAADTLAAIEAGARGRRG